MLPSGETLDFVEYGDNILLPEECPSDDWAGVYATVRIQSIDNTEEVTNVYTESSMTTTAVNKKRPRVS